MKCLNCFGKMPWGVRFCPHCGTATGQIKTEIPIQPLYASLGKRFLAQLLDGVIAFSFFWLIGRTVATECGGLTPAGFELAGAPALLVISSTQDSAGEFDGKVGGRFFSHREHRE
jgi:hypothetical protein